MLDNKSYQKLDDIGFIGKKTGRTDGEIKSDAKKTSAYIAAYKENHGKEGGVSSFTGKTVSSRKK